MILDEEEDFPFGEAPNGTDSDTDDGCTLEDSGAMNVDASSSKESDSEADHYLDRTASCEVLAREFVGDQNKNDERQPPLPAAHVHGIRCGCSHECLKKFSPENVESNRLTMRELEKDEKEMIVFGVLESVKWDENVTARGKKG